LAVLFVRFALLVIVVSPVSFPAIPALMTPL
jgi:hypothetical protein